MLMQHNDHGLHNVASKQEQEDMEKLGWVVLSEHPAIEKARKMKLALTSNNDIITPQVEAPKAKLGRPSTKKLGGSNGNSPNTNQSKP